MRMSDAVRVVMMASVLLLSLSAVTVNSAVPSFPLNNTAVAGLTIPAIGVGTGAYAYCPNVGYGGYPECFDDAAGCSDYSMRTILSWLQLGGRRLDCANSYGNTRTVGRAWRQSGVPRKEIFITEKVGPPPSVPLGYADTLIQVDELLRDLQTEYIDLILIHEPVGSIPQSADPYCRQGSPKYNERDCRLSTWKALLKVFNDGKALSIGVSNWNITHLQEVAEAGLPLPAVNQCPFNYYHSSVQQELRDYCAANGILFHGYAPLGAPDVFVYPYKGTGMSYIQLEDPTVLKIAQSHGVSAAQVLIQWQYALGLPINVRSQNVGHMTDNLNSYSFTLSDAEISTLNSGPQAVNFGVKPLGRPVKPLTTN